MKQKDIALIVIVVIISAVVSILISKAIFSTPQNRQQQVDVVQPISSDFPQPDNRYFNHNAFDPAQPITIGKNANPNPFNSSGQ